ncbi:MAG: hypothetical protein GY950_03700 [bacterium]|nr:hypothetical protein [bacterium]
MPIIILAMFFFRRLLERFTVKKVNAALLLAFLALVCYTEYVKIPGKHGALGFDVTQPVRDWTTIRRYHNDFEVKYNLPIRESKVFFARSSSLRLKEPVFGYRMGKFFPNLNITEGAVTGSDTDYYNMTHPASLVFPEENNLSLFERIPRRDAENFDKFITYRVPQWKISKLQQIANRVSVVSAVLALLILFYYLAGYIYKNKIRRKIQ